MIDNYDSFTYNLVQYFGELGCEVDVYRNDAVTVEQVSTLKPAWIVISPGPGTPNDAGVSLEVIRLLGATFPILGVCLGHQCIVQAFGGKITHADTIMHGKVSLIEHDGTGIYQHITSPLTVTRYHSLIADKKTLPDCLSITAVTRATSANDEHDVVMSVAHKNKPLYGVQYHPESILTQQGKEILKNFLRLTKKIV